MKRWRTFLNAGLIPGALLALILNTCLSWSLAPPAQTIITTVAGLSAVNGTLANTQYIEEPFAVTADGSGGFYFAAGESRVYRVTSDGHLNLVAGRGTNGFTGDAGPAAVAQLNGPRGIALAPNGDLSIADSWNSRVRKITIAGVISTIAGTGSGYPGSDGDGGPATSAILNYPHGVAVDLNGNLFIALPYIALVRKVTAGGIITTVAGRGGFGGGFSGDGGPATSAVLGGPYGVAADQSGNLFIADTPNNRIRKVDANGIITTVAGNGTTGSSGDGGPAILAQLWAPRRIAVDQIGNLFIADSGNNRIRKVSSNGIISTVAGNGVAGFSGDGGTAISAQLSDPGDIAVDGIGNLFIADTENYRIRQVTPTGTIHTVAGTGPSPAAVNYPFGVAFDGNDNLFVGSRAGIFKINSSGNFPVVANSPYASAGSIAIDGAGNLFFVGVSVLDLKPNLHKITPAGILGNVSNDFWSFFDYDNQGPNGEVCVAGLAVDPNGNLFVAEPVYARVWKVTPGGVRTLVAGWLGGGFSGDGGPATSAQLSFPNGVALDQNGNLFIADSNNNRIRKVSPNGIITTVAGDGTPGFGGDGGPATFAQLWYPLGVAADQAGNIFIADSHNSRIRMVSTDGIITTVAGNGTFGFSGDGGAPTSAQLDYPSSVALDSKGNLFIADSGNNRIRALTTINNRRSQLTSQ